MLTASYISEHVDEVKRNCELGGAQIDIDLIVYLENERKQVSQSLDEIRTRSNAIAKSFRPNLANAGDLRSQGELKICQMAAVMSVETDPGGTKSTSTAADTRSPHVDMR